MSAFGGLILTNKGRNLQTKAQTGVQLNFTKVKVGDGDLSGQSILDLNDLISVKKELSLLGVEVLTEGKAKIKSYFSNSDIVTGFYWRELGIYANDPDEGEILYCYGNAGVNAEYIPAGGGPDVTEKYLSIITIVGNAENVTATLNSGIYLAKVDLESTDNNKGASLVGIEDTGGYYTSANVEEALQEIGTEIAGIKEDYKISKALPFNSTESNASVISYPDNLDPDDPTNGLFRPGVKGVEPREQIALNGDFSDGTNNLLTAQAGMVVSDGTVTYTGNGTGLYPQVRCLTNFSYMQNKKMFVKVIAKVTNGEADLLYTQVSGVEGSQDVKLITNPTANQEYIISGIITLSNSYTGNVSLNVITKYVDAATSNGKSTIVKEVVAYDVTDDTRTDDEIIADYEVMPYHKGLTTCALSYDLVSEGKNKFDESLANTLNVYHANNSISFNGNKIVYKATTEPTTTTFTKLKLKPNTEYSIAPFNRTGNFSNLLIGIKISDSSTYTSTGKTFTTPNDGIVGLFFITQTNNTQVDCEFNIMLTEGSTLPTTYEPYTCDKTEFSVPWEYGLYKLQNGKENKINHDTGDLDIEVKRKTLDGEDVTGMVTTYTNIDYARIPRLKLEGIIQAELDSGIIEDYPSKEPNDYDNNKWIGYCDFNADNTNVWIGFAKGTTLEQAQTALAGKYIYYQLTQSFSIEDGQQGYKAPSYIQAYQSGDLVVRPKIDFYKTLNNETTITLENTMVELEGVYAQLDDDMELELLPVTLNADGKSIELSSAYDGLVHIKGIIDSKECLLPIVTGNLAINIAAQVGDNMLGVIKLNNDVSTLKDNAEFTSRQIAEMKVTITKDLIISSGSWTEDVANSRWYCQVTDSDVTADMVVNVNIHLSDLDKTDMLLPVTESSDGYYRLYADTQPSQNFTVDVVKQN